jgi:hypothetical protein
MANRPVYNFPLWKVGQQVFFPNKTRKAAQQALDMYRKRDKRGRLNGMQFSMEQRIGGVMIRRIS